MNRFALTTSVLLGAVSIGGCSSASSTSTSTSPASSSSASSRASGASRGAASQDTFPSVVKVSPSRSADGSWTFDVTMTSPYDSADRYADGWRVKSGTTVFGEMTLGHDHASEQPFTRTQTAVRIPASVTSVVVEGRDLKNGYGGKTATVVLPG